MKIIKHGNQKDNELFICHHCGCEFIPESDEKYISNDQHVYSFCPECSVQVYLENEINEPKLNKRIERREKIINEIVNFVEFDRIHTAMKALNWNWWNIGVPSEEQIKNETINRLREAFDKKQSSYSGGIYIKYLPYDEDGDEGLKFSFVLEDCSAFYDHDGNLVTNP